ncbi:MAG: Na/Pi symporter, partial [Acidobacteria bacterium]|nr:Na/Pi symporter [Acidobacteriota bacterium]
RMRNGPLAISRRRPSKSLVRAGRVVAALAFLFIFLLGVKGLGDGFKLLSKDLVESFFRATGNPFVGLIVGILATTLVQSSSVTTAMIVGFVAAPENPLPLANAIPMIMGANIGTTVTNTLVSLAHIGRREEFRRAFSAATCHDFFNYMAVLILLPFELMTGYLRRSAEMLTSLVTGIGVRGVDYESPLSSILKFAFEPIKNGVSAVIGSQSGRATALILISGVLIFTSLMLLVRVMRSMLQSRVEIGLVNVLGKSGALAIVVGIVVTVMVQSSSITTSLLIPMAGAGIITLEHIFPITIGANIGTTVTALLASMAVTGPNAAAGITIALVHLLFNLTASAIIYPTPAIRRLPLAAARGLANVAVRSKTLAITYVFGLFYILPAIVAVIDYVFFVDRS